jgi:hypothetical protein
MDQDPLYLPVWNRPAWVRDGDYEFRTYDQNGNPGFVGRIWKARCAGVTADGKRCRKTTQRVHPYCLGCMANILHLAIADSTLGPHSGLGLFAYDPTKSDGEVVFRCGKVFAPYMGEVLSDHTLVLRYSTVRDLETETKVCCPYAIDFPAENHCLDGALYRGPGAFANDGGPERNNAELFGCENGMTGLQATRDIYQNEEILTSYGDDYWLGSHPTHEVVRIK